jgi:heme A synthase
LLVINRRYASFAWGVLAYNILVILWGAFVRATGSGAGCGSHWPLCNGEVIPRAESTEVLIEYSHRITSGLALIGVVVMLVWALRAYPRGHRVRKGAIVAMVFMIIEALIGAGLVLLELVAYNVSIARAYWMAGHLINTFFLVAALTMTAWWASGGASLRLRGQRALPWAFGMALLAMLVLGASGGITALGDTLVLGAGITPEESPVVAQLVALRIYHPLIAFVVGAMLAGAAFLAVRRHPADSTRRLAITLGVLYTVQLLLGALNVTLKAPVWLQLVHLFMSNLIWIVLVLLAADTLAEEAAEEASVEQIAEPTPALRSSSAA